MTSTTFIPGTVIASTWLNDVNTVVYNNAGGPGGLGAATGSALVGYTQGGTGAVARTVQSKLRDSVSAMDVGAIGDGVTNDTAALTAAFAKGVPIDLEGRTYVVQAGMRFIAPVISNGATLKFTAAVGIALTLSPGCNVLGGLTLDTSTIVCGVGVLCNGAEQSTHLNAQKSEAINIIGQDHTNSGIGIKLDSTVAGASNSAWLHYMRLSSFTVQNYQTGIRLQADNTSLTLSYVNANILDEFTFVGCKKSISLSATNTADISSNFIQRYVVQYGAVLGDFPTVGIEILGTASSNHVQGFIYDWDHTNSTGPIVNMDSLTRDNRVESSAFSWEMADAGTRNIYTSATSPVNGTTWETSFGRNYLGSQDNTLAHWLGAVGTLTGTTSTTGTAVCNLATGTLIDVQRENQNFIGVAWTAGTGSAAYTIEFRSTTQPINNLSVVGAYFEPGFLPNEVVVQIDTGSGYVSRADVIGVQNSNLFLRLDQVSNTDVYSNVLGIKFILRASDTRTVKLREVYANGSLMKSTLSRGGDRMVGDIRFPAGVGPVLVDTVTGTEYRIQITSGAIALTANPTKVLTYF